MNNMNDMDVRERALKQDVLLVGIIGLAVLNGMHFSPWLNVAFLLTKPFFQVTFLISSPLLIFYFTSLALSTLTIMLAGIPAAIFERVTVARRRILRPSTSGWGRPSF